MGEALYEQPSTAVTASGSSGPLAVGVLTQLAVDVDVTALSGTSPTLTIFVERQGADGNWYPIYSPSAINATGLTSTSIGPGLTTPALVTSTVRFRWVIGGSATPTVTFSVSVIAR